MMLCVDAGNTRVKWGIADESAQGDPWLETGLAEHGHLSVLAALPMRYPAIRSIWIANVAGDKVRAELADVFAGWAGRLHWVRSQACAGGVENGYLRPETLGVDRWCGLVAAWQRTGRATLVVSLGTATTVDALDDAGHFPGGMILPGVTLMRRSLAERTAQLPLVAGQDAGAGWQWPQGTDEAIQTGTLVATVGVIELAWSRLAVQSAKAPACLLTGGASPGLVPHLSMPAQVVPHLVLEGLLSQARAAGTGQPA